MNESDLCEESISLIMKKFEDYLKRIKEKKKVGQPSRFPTLTVPETVRKPLLIQGNPRQRNEGRFKSTKKDLDSVHCRECSGYGHYANECVNRLRRKKGMNATLSDEESEEEQEPEIEETRTSLTAHLHERNIIQVNPFGFATGVATPSPNTTKISLSYCCISR